jgi:DNA-binding NtrC family response regulator
MKKDFPMPEHTVSVSSKKPEELLVPTLSKKRVLVFSPDADLAQVLLLNLEDRFHIVREHCLDRLEKTIDNIAPDLVLVDLYTFSENIVKQLDIIRRTTTVVPVIALRAYMSLTPEMNKSIDELTDVLFYKPVDVELVTQAIEDLLK